MDLPASPDPLGLLGRVLHRDGMMLIIDKPAGLPVHPGPGGGPTLTAHLDVLRFGLPRDPELAHRLDKDTAGCLVLGRHRKALDRLATLFRQNLIAKTYWAVVAGKDPPAEGTIDLPIGPRDPHRGWWMKVDPKGQPALTRYRALASADGHWLLALEPVTGRTHQLRVHCAAMGWPILGDPIYGTAPRHGGPGLHLLARSITVPLAKNGPAVSVTATVPSHMAAWLTRLMPC